MLIDFKNLCSKLQINARAFKYALLGLLWVGSCNVFAGNACAPYSYAALNLSITPTTISATPNNTGADKLLTQISAQSGNASECTTSSSANLRFYTMQCGASCAYSNSSGLSYISGSGQSVDIYFISTETAAARLTLYNGVSSPNPIFKIVQKINVQCPGGGLIVSSDGGNPGGYRVDGINAAACNGLYAVRHTVSIYQTPYTPPLGTPISTITLGSNINLGIKLYDGINPTEVIDRWGQINNSGQVNLNFVSSKCTVTAPSSLNLGVLNTTGLSEISGAYSSTRTTNFNITLSGCSGSSYNQVSFFWVFSDVDSRDDSILLNSNTSNANNANNVGVQLIYVARSGAQSNVRHRYPLPIEYSDLPSVATSSANITFKAKMVKSTNVINSSDIRPGAFSANATLFVQYQ